METSRERADIHRYAPSSFIKEGAALPDHYCRECAYYVADLPERNCARVYGVIKTVGPLWAACDKFSHKTHYNTMEEPIKDPQTKVCKKCGRELPAEAFGRHHRTKDGLQPICKECRSKMEKGNPKYGRRKKDGTVSIPAAHAQEVRDFIESKHSGKAKEAIRDDSAHRKIVEDLIDHDTLRYFNDLDLCNELRRRGYDVKCSKTIEL